MNTYFRFKQFQINQSQCQMKVSETACIQGAWTPIPNNAQHILDIGSGTGLLSLMMAQRSQAQITAVEIEPLAYKQSLENCQASTFANRIQLINRDILSFNTPQKFNLIICNPPFFEGQLASPDEEKNVAWHSHKLSLKELIKKTTTLLSEEGSLSLLLPYSRKNEIEIIANSCRLYPKHYLFIRHSSQHDIRFLVGIFTKHKAGIITETLSIRENQQYTQTMQELMADFYLKC